jgi:hypothetical protein
MEKKFFTNKPLKNQYMHRAFFITGIAMLLMLAGLTGCKKFLDLPLKDKVPESILFQDEQGFKDAMIGVYLALDKPTNGGTYSMYTKDLSMGMLSALAYNYDNANTANVGEGSPFYNSLILYNYADATVKAEIDGLWGGMYNTIANVNNLLGQIDEKKGLFTKDNYYRVKGEAIGARALLHFDLLRLFGPSPATVTNQKAIPYVRLFGVRPTHFSTVNEALDSCIRDLHEAKNLLALADTSRLLQAANDLYAAYTQNHINYWTVEALLARAHLYKGNYDSAAYYATMVIGSNKFPVITSNVAAASNIVRDRLFSQEIIFSVYSANVKKYNSDLFAKSPGALQLSTNARNVIYVNGNGSANDYRYVSSFQPGTIGLFVPTKFFQDDNLPYQLQNNVPVVRISEMYYIAAEAANAKNDINTAIYYLNKIRQGRGLANLNPANVSTPDNVSTEIMKEHQKEFMQEGQTFFYYKRLNKNLSTVTSNTAVIPANAYVFPLPDKELEYNK